jgi:hypothetical protein
MGLLQQYAVEDITNASFCVFQLVSNLMQIELNEAHVLPEVQPEGLATLSELQAVTQRLWGFAVPKFINLYDPQENRIYLFRDLDFYERFGRSIYDSLAHEFVHFVQAKVRQTPLLQFGEAEENEAIHIQNQFRQRYHSLVVNHQFHCPI